MMVRLRMCHWLVNDLRHSLTEDVSPSNSIPMTLEVPPATFLYQLPKFAFVYGKLRHAGAATAGAKDRPCFRFWATDHLSGSLHCTILGSRSVGISEPVKTFVRPDIVKAILPTANNKISALGVYKGFQLA